MTNIWTSDRKARVAVASGDSTKVENMPSLANAYDDLRISSLLADYVDGVAPLETLLKQYNVSYQQIGDLVDLADQLRGTLVEVSPSLDFTNSLLAELVGSKSAPRFWWDRVQTMPNRVKIAAGIGGITLTAGMLLITARSLSYLLGLRHREETPREAVA